VRELTELLEPIASAEGYELVAVEQAGGRRTPIIRVFLDQDGGIGIDAICQANSWVSAAIDEADPMSGPYSLEVSSPGVDRPLAKLADFERFVGEQATVKTRPRSESRSSWTGVIVGVDDGSVVLDVDGEHVSIRHDDVVKARLKGAISFDR
jgi:ribosome maturation factor RimP